MPRPSFTPAEQLMIGRILAPSDSSLLFEAAYLLPAAAFIAFGFVYSAPAAFATAFAIIAAFRVWHVANNHRGLPVLREIIRKFERACVERQDSNDAP